MYFDASAVAWGIRADEVQTCARAANGQGPAMDFSQHPSLVRYVLDCLGGLQHIEKRRFLNVRQSTCCGLKRKSELNRQPQLLAIPIYSSECQESCSHNSTGGCRPIESVT
jgi:hypothetical protein